MEINTNFSGRAHKYTEEEIGAVVEAIMLRRYLNWLEGEFCQYTGAKHAFAVSDATAALELVAQLCQFRQSEETIIHSHTFTSSAYPEQESHHVGTNYHNNHLLAALMANEEGFQCVVQCCLLNRYPLYQKSKLNEAVVQIRIHSLPI